MCHCGRKAKSKSERFCLTEANSRCLYVGRKVFARPRADASISTAVRRLIRKCHAIAVRASPTSRTQRKKSCMDDPGKMRTRCPCYSNEQPCSSLCSCKECGNKDGIRKPCCATDALTSRRKRMTSSPRSLKRARTITFLENRGFNV